MNSKYSRTCDIIARRAQREQILIAMCPYHIPRNVDEVVHKINTYRLSRGSSSLAISRTVQYELHRMIEDGLVIRSPGKSKDGMRWAYVYKMNEVGEKE